MLSVDGLEAGYGTLRVVRELCFSLPPAEITALLGSNGAGKTTTLGAISGTVRRFRGEVRIGSTPLPSRPDAVAAKGVAHVPQGRRVFSELTVSENLLVATLHLSRGAAAAEVRRVFDLFPILQPLADRRGGFLSGGEQQMLAIGRAIVARPKVLMIDELSLGLAPKIVADFGPILQKLAGDDGMTILMVEQNAHFAKSLASRVMIMSQGRIIHAGDAAMFEEASLLRAAYLGVPGEAATSP